MMAGNAKKPNPQLPLDLPLPVTHRREDIIESEANRMAISMLDGWPNWKSHVSVLAGPVGAGKTHIASVWADKADALQCLSQELGEHMDRFVAYASDGGCILIEDAGAGVIDETAMFHLLNAIRQGGGYCLITSRSWPVEWAVKLPDLASRLKAVQVFELREPDDDLLRQVMFKLFADRQLVVDDKVIDYCVLRMERSLESAGRLVDAIDAEALARKSPITRSTAASALQALAMN